MIVVITKYLKCLSQVLFKKARIFSLRKLKLYILFSLHNQNQCLEERKLKLERQIRLSIKGLSLKNTFQPPGKHISNIELKTMIDIEVS